MTAALQELLRRSLPAGTVIEGPILVALRAAGRDTTVTVTGLAKRLVLIDHGGRSAASAGGRAVLSVSLEGGSLRVDLPVEVLACGDKRVVLRAMAAPLVLRRRVVRDQALAEALGVRAAAASEPVMADSVPESVMAA